MSQSSRAQLDQAMWIERERAETQAIEDETIAFMLLLDGQSATSYAVDALAAPPSDGEQASRTAP
jgi:hypothetical protein